MATAEEEIRALWSSATNALSCGDWETYSRLWVHAPYICVFHPDQGEWLTGWEAVSRKYMMLIASGRRPKVTYQDLSIRVSSDGQMAWATASITIAFEDVPTGPIETWQTLVFERDEDSWRLVLGHVSIPESNYERQTPPLDVAPGQKG
jgi:ketosteroid isomerase-like protein